MALRDAGFRVVNLFCGLGRPEQRERRIAELAAASEMAGFEARVPESPPIVSSRTDDPAWVSARLLELTRGAIADLFPNVVVSSSPHDRHPSHELVARAVRDALPESGLEVPRWWMWGLWGDLPLPTIGTAFDQPRLQEILDALGAYSGELTRNDYRLLVRGRAMMNTALAPERLFGFGSDARAPAPYVELLTETIYSNGAWLLGKRRWLDPNAPFAEADQPDISDWLEAQGVVAAQQSSSFVQPLPRTA